MASIKLTGIKKVYSGEVVAVDNFSLDIDDREFVIFVGPSGCGKTTTLRMIAGLEEITSGEIYIDGRLVNDVQPKDRDIAMVFQSYALYPHMTVYKNLAFSLKMRKTPKIEIDRSVRRTAEILGISHLLSRKPRALSGGERQRVALGRAMVRDPKVFLLDEPLSNLDAKLRTDMRAEIIKLHRDIKTTFIYVTHDQTEAMTMGDRIVIMDKGLILQVDTPRNIYNHPANLFVAGFIGSPQMNFFDGVVERGDDGYSIALECGSILSLRGISAAPGTLNALDGRTVRMGVRPEHLSLDLENAPSDKTITGVAVELSEMLGAESYIHLTVGQTKITARVPASIEAMVGDVVGVSVQPDKLHLFDIETGASITGRADTEVAL